MATTTITGKVFLPDGTTSYGGRIEADPVGGHVLDDGQLAVGTTRAYVSPYTGAIFMQLVSGVYSARYYNAEGCLYRQRLWTLTGVRDAKLGDL